MILFLREKGSLFYLVHYSSLHRTFINANFTEKAFKIFFSEKLKWCIVKCTSMCLRGVIKKFVDWRDEINTYWVMHTNFSYYFYNIKQQIFYQLWKYKLDSFINNYFISERNLYGMVTRCSLRWVPWRSTTSLFFSILSIL